MKILYVNPMPIFPILQGNQRTGLNRILELSKTNEVTFVSFYETENERSLTENSLKKYCKRVVLIKRSKVISRLSMIAYLFSSNVPFQVAYYRSKRMTHSLAELSKNNYDIIHINTIRMVQYSPIFRSPVLIDLHDSMILNIRRRLGSESFFKKLFYIGELNRIKKYETSVIRNHKSIMVLADQDKEALGSHFNVSVIHLGVNINDFRRKLPLQNNKIIIFSGNMSYTPNVEAVEWFVTNCWRNIKAEIPIALFKIVGANPSERIQKLNQIDGVLVTGRVESIKVELENSNLAIAPMLSGSGMQNKILEAMACEIPVITTTLGLGNIKATINSNVLIADRSDDFQRYCISVLNDFNLAQQLGRNAKKLMEKSYSVTIHCKELEDLYSKTIYNYANLSQ